MIISHKLGCIFVHIQKTGGLSVETVLRENDDTIDSQQYGRGLHRHARALRPLVSPEQWQRYYKFAFVRNPWDRLVSWYAMCVQVTAPNDFARYVQTHTKTFSDFVKHATTGIVERTTWNQLDYVVDEGGELMVDYVGRYESLGADFATVANRLRIPAALPHVNRSNHRDYRQYYTDETREIVAQRYARDIATYGYVF